MANLAEIGLNIKVENITWTDLCHECQQEEPAIELVGTWANADIPGPSYFLDWFSILWGAATPFGIIHYRNPEVNKLYVEVTTSDEQEYLARMAKAQKIITEDCPVVFTANSGHYIAHRDYVKGYRYIGAGVWDMRFDKLTIEK